MIHVASPWAIVIFSLFVSFTIGLSFWLSRKTQSAQGYFAAGGGIHWFVNGIAFAGDYLSAASFLGICGMISFFGYDGFLYSIGYLAGWIVALFVIAEPLKRLGKYTFADALDARFQSRALKLAAAVSTLAVSIFYLIPQMVGAGALIKPLLNFEHYQGVLMVGAVVVLIVVSAGMVSTTYVQFLKGSLLVFFSAILTIMILNRGVSVSAPPERKISAASREAFVTAHTSYILQKAPSRVLVPNPEAWKDAPYFQLRDATGRISVWREIKVEEPGFHVFECQTRTITPDGKKLVNGLPQGLEQGQADFWPVGHVSKLPGDATSTGPQGPLAFLSTLQGSEMVTWKNETFRAADGATTIFYPQITKGSDLLRPGNVPAFKGLRSDKFFDKLNFLSLMLALFGGTASLPHILIRYYTVKDQAAARKSTIVGIGSIGFFYVLTLFLGLGAMTSGALDVTDTNMSAPLLAKSLSHWLFAVISAIAFTTVLGTVSGLIMAASGAVVHDLAVGVLRIEMNDHAKVRLAKIAAVGVGVIAIVLGILFEKMNVNYLVGWAFSLAASANLPSLVMLLFWKGTTKQGITAAVTVGMLTSLTWILASGDTYKDVYGWPEQSALVPFSQPGIVTIPLGFLVLVVVSLLTRTKEAQPAEAVPPAPPGSSRETGNPYQSEGARS
jgi:cation/acetate symporter